ncbi:MAG: hypothetical protein QOC80_2650, partial [Frankiaceae bacterium]|nr:hypothetical protein [Frankiaceae bacterium]
MDRALHVDLVSPSGWCAGGEPRSDAGGRRSRGWLGARTG